MFTLKPRLVGGFSRKRTQKANKKEAHRQRGVPTRGELTAFHNAMISRERFARPLCRNFPPSNPRPENSTVRKTPFAIG